jgi:protoheme IX farnesyltransferase
MLPVVASFARTARQIVIYTVVLWATSLIFTPVAGMGLIYTVSALVLGAVFLLYALRLQKRATPKQAMKLFSYSISYVTLLFGAMALDQLVRR